MAKLTDLRKVIRAINKHQSYTCQPDLARVLTAQISRSCYLLDLAAEEDDFEPVENAIYQTTDKLYATWKAEWTLYDLIKVFHQRNDEFGEKLTWSENWYLDHNPFLICFERKDLVSALRRSPIRDSARFGAFLRKQTQDLVSEMRENLTLEAAYTYCDKFALLAESARTADLRGGCHIFHSLVTMVGASWSYAMCITSWQDNDEDCKNCPARRLSQQLLEIIAGAVEERNRHLQLDHDSASNTSNGVSCDSELSWNFLLSWETLAGDFKKLLANHPREFSGDGVDGTCPPCPVKGALPVVRALLNATVNEVSDRALEVCGGRLPVELSDMVVEASILAEGLPLGRSIWEIVE